MGNNALSPVENKKIKERITTVVDHRFCMVSEQKADVGASIVGFCNFCSVG